MALYVVYNGVSATAAAPVPVTTGTAIKTLLQVKGVTALTMKVVEWGISLDGAAASTVKCELMEAGTVFATVTTLAAADTIALDAQALGVAAGTYFAYGTTSTGYTATGEGTVTAGREFDAVILTCPAVTAGAVYVKQFPLGREPYVNAVSSLRVRVTATAAVNATCYVVIEV